MDTQSENWIQYLILLHASYWHSKPNLKVLGNRCSSHILKNPQNGWQLTVCCLRAASECSIILIKLLLLLIPKEDLSSLVILTCFQDYLEDHVLSL